MFLLGVLFIFLHARAMVNICGIFGIRKRHISSQDTAFKYRFYFLVFLHPYIMDFWNILQKL